MPLKSPPGYFNYDYNDTAYGPGAWGNIKSEQGNETEEYRYWMGFQDSIRRDLDENVCGTGSRQSPIDLRLNAIVGYEVGAGGELKLPHGGTDSDGDGKVEDYEEGVCYEHHQIRTSVSLIRHSFFPEL